MKGRVGGGHLLSGAPSDLLVCFPSRAHLARVPKPICSPSRLIDNSRHPSSRPVPNRSHASPLSHTKTVNHMSPDMDEEPMSPKVSCAGQIKVRPKSQPISEGLFSTNKKQSWLEALGLKRDILQFFTARLRFNMGCFNFTLNYTSDKEEEVNSTLSGGIFPKCFMMLDAGSIDSGLKDGEREVSAEIEQMAGVPPANALLLMRCRSAPAKAKKSSEGGEEGGGGEIMMMSTQSLREEEKEKEKEGLMFMSYAPDFLKLSMDIADETWVGAGAMDPLARCESCKT